MAEKKTILIVKTIFIWSGLILSNLKKRVNVVSAGDGEAAIEFLEKNKQPDMIILDLMLPKKNGFEVLQEIKSNNKWKNIPWLFCPILGKRKILKRQRNGRVGLYYQSGYQY